MRHVFSNDMLAHVFAQQTHDYGRSGNGTLSFEGDTIRSYATPVGRIVQSADGRSVLLMTAASYSVTTSAHCSRIGRAFPGNDVFRVPSLGVSGGRHREPSRNDSPDHTVNIAFLLGEHETAKARLRRMVSDPYDIAGTLGWTARQAQGYAAAFGLPCAIDVEADAASVATFRAERETRLNTPANIAKRERARVRREADKAKADARRREANRIACLESSERIGMWRQGAPVSLRYHEQRTAEGSAMLRIKPGRPDIVETSQGAVVPATDARRAVEAIRRVRETGSPWTRNGDGGIPVGHFTVDHIDAQGNIRAGCHSIAWVEVETLATSQGW